MSELLGIYAGELRALEPEGQATGMFKQALQQVAKGEAQQQLISALVRIGRSRKIPVGVVFLVYFRIRPMVLILHLHCVRLLRVWIHTR